MIIVSLGNHLMAFYAAQNGELLLVQNFRPVNREDRPAAILTEW
jgi:hypothetical protein